MSRFRTAILLVTILGLCGCAEPASQPAALPTTQMELGGKTFTLEIAKNDRARQRGLMYRDSMPADWGMIFVFPDARVRMFWMKNTRIPLDIIFLRPDGQIVGIKQMKALDMRSTSSDAPAMYAIELNEGMAKSIGLKVGDKLAIPPEARTAED